MSPDTREVLLAKPICIGGRPLYQLAFENWEARVLFGVAIVAASSYLVAVSGEVPFQGLFLSLLFAWAVSTWLSDKYRHKYPQRYYPYLLASHGKAAVIMGSVLLLFAVLAPSEWSAVSAFRAATLVVVADFLVSVPRTRMKEEAGAQTSFDGDVPPISVQSAPLASVNMSGIGKILAEAPDVASFEGLPALIADCVERGDSGAAAVRVIEEDSAGSGDESGQVAFLLQRKSLNTVRRLNLFLQGLPGSVLMGGYLAFRYRPMEELLEELLSKKKGLGLWLSYGWHFLRHRALPKMPVLEKLYFSKCFSALDSWVYERTKENRRVISRAEMWGRMYYWGFEVLGERKIGEDHWVVTRRVRGPEMARKPSFFLVARLTKVGLDGKPLRLHKLRTMYPFSEFVQERVYRDHGLSETGKFKNDFRLTDYGRFLRRYWLDEIPQIFDWLRGEIKLVGMRATSPHYLSLYPQGLYDLYVQTKPGLIPPIFDASTAGFDDIVKIELAYLNAYQRRPVATDVRYLFKTLNDIVIRGVRSK